MELFEFKNGMPCRIDHDTVDLTVADILKGPFIIKYASKNLPIYFVGDDDDLCRYLLKENKSFLSLWTYYNAIIIALRFKNRFIEENITLHSFFQIAKEELNS